MQDLSRFDPVAFTYYDYSGSDTHHVTLVCENEIVVMYIDDAKAFSSRIRHSINGAHICLFAEEGSAEFTNITMKLPQ